MYADRTPYPYYYEVKKVYQNIAIQSENVQSGMISVTNRNYFKDLSDNQLNWQLIENGLVVAQGNGLKLTAKARETQSIKLKYNLKFKPDAEYFLKLLEKANGC